MADSDLFIGVVTHGSTRFPQARGPQGAAALLAHEIRQAGLSVQVAAEDRDLWTESARVLSYPPQVAYGEELLEEWRWRGFLGARSWRWSVLYLLRWLRHLTRSRSTDDRASKRLLDIEMAHRSLWDKGLASNAGIIVILEDDAAVDDPVDVAQGIVGLIESPWSFANLSLSFTNDQIGARELLSDSGLLWSGRLHRMVLRSRRPITNTVCAVAYKREYLTQLVAQWDTMPLEPILPIDWKMNRALREMVESGTLEVDSSLWIEPGPLVQRSLHPQTRS